MSNKRYKILFVDDCRLTRMLIKAMLEKLDYQFITASSPEEAINLFEKEKLSIDLLLTDFMMPGLNGYELKNELEKIKPGIQSLFISGNSIAIIKKYFSQGESIHFLQKPFTISLLAEKISDILNIPEVMPAKTAIYSKNKKFIRPGIY